MDFTAIDFETATYKRDSACQLAAVRVRGGEIVHQASWLIRPRPLSFSSGNIAIHGIRPADVENEPEFGVLWPEIASTIGDDPIIAHNASFDLGVLMACLQTHEQPIPEIQYSCTRAIARRTWPHLPRFGLKPLSDWLGVRFRHHDALEDSIACAQVALAAAADKQVAALEDLERVLGLQRGRVGEWGKRGLTGPRTSRRPTRARSTAQNRTEASRQQVTPPAPPSPQAWTTPSGTDLQRLLIRAEFIRALDGRRVVFTGTLTHLDRDDAMEMTRRCGGTCQTNVSGRTDMVVVGAVDSRTRSAGRTMSVKEERARALQADGKDIQIVTEDEFIRFVVS